MADSTYCVGSRYQYPQIFFLFCSKKVVILLGALVVYELLQHECANSVRLKFSRLVCVCLGQYGYVFQLVVQITVLNTIKLGLCINMFQIQLR